MFEAKLEDYIRLCQDVYYPNVDFFYPEIRKTDKENTPVNGFYPNSFLQKEHGWTRHREFKEDPTGFFAVCYKRLKDDGTRVIVFRGSDDIYDFAHHDLKIAHNEWPKCFLKALKFYGDITDEGLPKKLFFAGHSLGGALAQLMAIHANSKDYFAKQHQCLAICFNAPQMGYITKYVNPGFIRTDTAIDFAVDDLRKRLDSRKSFSKTCNNGIINISEDFNKFKSILKNSDLNIGCSALTFALHTIPDGKKFIDQSVESIAEIYRKMAAVKNLKDCARLGQPAFNSIYHLVTPKPNEFSFNLKSFTNHYDELANGDRYKYIYNFNSFYDLVHACGMPIGSQLEIDIDKTITNEKNKQMRSQAELRTFLTLQPEYFSQKAEKFKFEYLKTKVMATQYSFNTLKFKTECTLDLQKDVLQHLNVDYSGYLYLINKAQEHFLSSNRWLDEAEYYLKTQHVMGNLGNALLADPSLYSISFESHNNTKSQFKNYRNNNPLEKFDASFHLKIRDMIIDNRLLNENKCQAF